MVGNKNRFLIYLASNILDIVSFRDSALVQPGRDAPFGPASVVSSHQVQTHDDQLDKSSPQRALLQKLVSVSTWVSTILRRDFVEAHIHYV